jgi:high-affinity Fe2+/Pb2+ permease
VCHLGFGALNTAHMVQSMENLVAGAIFNDETLSCNDLAQHRRSSVQRQFEGIFALVAAKTCRSEAEFTRGT